jgi:hypothetical protein
MAAALLALSASRHHRTRKLLMAVFASLLTACTTTGAPPNVTKALPMGQDGPAVGTVASAEAQALQSLVSMQERLYRVAGPLLTNNAHLCKDNAHNLIGFTAKNRYSYSSEYVNVAPKTLGLDERLQISGLLAGSGAARAGMQRGDVLLSVEDQTVSEGENAESQTAAILGPLLGKRSNVQMTVLRKGSNVVLNVPLTFACGFGIELGNTDNVTAYSDGYRVLITRGMLNYARIDDELAYVMAKEMAHNVLAHPVHRKLSTTLGGAIDNLKRIRPDLNAMSQMAAVKPMPQDMDAAADRLALYMLARANYNLEPVISFWQNLASQYPVTVSNGYTAMHPATTSRVAAMKRALKDIRAKRDANKPLVP